MKKVFFFEIEDFPTIRQKAEELGLNWDDYKESFLSVLQIPPSGASQEQSQDIPFERLVSFHRFTWLRHRFMNSLCHKNDDFISPEEVLKTITSWLERNCIPHQPEWEPYSVSERIINWSWCLIWLRALKAIHSSEQNLLESAIKTHASYLETHLEYHGKRTNNHILKDAQGLMYAGCLFFDDKNAQRWRDTAKDIFLSELDRQFSKDRVHLEQTSHYHCLCARRYVECLLLADKASLNWAEELRLPIKGMIDAAYALTFPDSTIPLFSDVSPDEPPSLAPRTLLNLGAYIFNKAEYLQKSGGLNLEALWLLGKNAINGRIRQPVEHRYNRLEVYPESFAAGDDGNTCWRLDCGPVDFKDAPGHGHNDMLSLQVWDHGHLWIRDSGISTYDDYKWKKYFKSTYAHSTIVIDGKEQLPEPGKLDIILRRWPTGKAYPVWSKVSEYFAAVLCEHTGYLRFGVGVLHKRLIVASRLTGYVIVMDYLTGKGKHLVEQLFQIDCERLSTDENKGGFELEYRSHKFTIIPFSNKTIHNAQQEGFFSPYYGNLRESMIISFKTQSELPVICGAILAPGKIGRMDVKAAFDPDNEPSLVLRLYYDSEIQHHIGINLSGKAASLAPFKGEFELACLYTDSDGGLNLVSDGECGVDKNFSRDRPISEHKFVQELHEEFRQDRC